MDKYAVLSEMSGWWTRKGNYLRGPYTSTECSWQLAVAMGYCSDFAKVYAV